MKESWHEIRRGRERPTSFGGRDPQHKSHIEVQGVAVVKRHYRRPLHWNMLGGIKDAFKGIYGWARHLAEGANRECRIEHEVRFNSLSGSFVSTPRDFNKYPRRTKEDC